MEEQCREQLAQLETCEADFETLTRASSLTETALSSKLAETQSLTKVVHELQRQAREAKDALAAAVSSNDHLKEQLHEQQARLEEKSGQDLQECQEPFEERLVEVKRQAEAEVALTNKQIEAMDGEVQECDQDRATELVRLLTEQEALMDEVKHLAGDASFWRSSWDAENANREERGFTCGFIRQALENEMNAAKHHFNGELLTLETDCERIAVNNEDLEQEIRDLSGEAQQKRRLMVSREGESSARQAAAEAHLKESQELLGFCQQRLRDAAEQRARATADAEGRQKAQEVQARFTMRERYGTMLENERQLHEQAKQECDRDSVLATSLTRQARDERRVRVEGPPARRRRPSGGES
eukprot:g1682.t1